MDATARRHHPRLASAAAEAWVRTPGGHLLRLVGRGGEPLRAPLEELAALGALLETAPALSAPAPPEPAATRERALLHDMRNELTHALLSLDRAALEDGAEPEGARRSVSLARDLCAGALAGGATTVRGSEVDLVPLRALLEERSRAAVATARGAGGVGVRLGCAADLQVLGEARALERLVHNLVSNAVEASPPGTVVRLTARRTGAHVALVVDDEGRGMHPRDVDQLFRPGTTGGAGTGWGTASILSCASALGATLALETGPGEGTRVEVLLRAAPRDGGSSVLLLDEDLERGAARAAQLTADGAAVWWACRAREASAWLAQGRAFDRALVARGAAVGEWPALRAALASRGIPVGVPSVLGTDAVPSRRHAPADT